MNRFSAKHTNSLVAILCLCCFLKLVSITIHRLPSVWSSYTIPDPSEFIEERRLEFSLPSLQKDDLLTILGVPAETKGPEIPRIILHDPLLCSQKDSARLNFVIYVHSFVDNWEKRQTLRSTFANPKLFRTIRFKVVFFLGMSTVMGLQQAIKKEFHDYKDVVQGNFIDAYKNMTLKAIFALSWISRYCSEADYAMKIDDDTFANIFEMISHMQQNVHSPLVIICPVWEDQTNKVLRNKTVCMKWCVTLRQFQGSAYPRYCSGLSYILSRALVPLLVDAVSATPFFWVDDVYVTGLLTQNMNVSDDVRYVTILHQTEFEGSRALSLMTNLSVPLTKHLFHVNGTEAAMTMWQLLLNRLTKQQRQMIYLSVAANHLKPSTNRLSIAPVKLKSRH